MPVRMIRALVLGLILSALLPAFASASTSLDAFSDEFEELVQRVDPAVVQIFATSYAPTGQFTMTSSLLTKQQGIGSGVILDPRGYIVTNAHVVSGARNVQVVLSSSASENQGSSVVKTRNVVLSAHIVGIDQETDLAVLKVRAKNDLPFLEIGDSELLRAGEVVLAFGSPLGLDNSVTMGIVSATARQLSQDSPMIYIQTDAPINPGNSGGALVNTLGQLVGINSMILSQSGGSEGLGFAAPSNIVKTIYEQMRDNGRVRRGMIGVNTQTVTPTLARGMRLGPLDKVVLSDVYPGGPAETAGLRVGDVIRTLDDKQIENGRQFDVNVYGKKIGSKVKVGYSRNGKDSTASVEVMERPGDPFAFVDMSHPEQYLIEELGILALTLDARIASILPAVRYPAGVVVAASSGTNATIWGDVFFPGDIIYNVNGSRVNDLDQLRREVGRLKSGDAFVVQVERQGQLKYLAFEVE